MSYSTMKTLWLSATIAHVLLAFGARAQQGADPELDANIRDIFHRPTVERCGEGPDAGIHICVPYYNCDKTTRTIIQNGSFDGLGSLDVRTGGSSCDNNLDVCCLIPKGGIPPEQPATSTKPESGDFCGIRNGNSNEMSGSNVAEFAEFPWMVQILTKHENGSVNAVCGASLISPRIVVTGAHCVQHFKTSDIRIRAGEWNTQTIRERLPYQEREISELIIHPEFKPLPMYNNIALLILSTPLTRAENIGTICLPPPGETNNAYECIVSGWGMSSFDASNNRASVLKKIKLPVVPRRQCELALQAVLGSHFKLHDSYLCAGGQQGQDACTGDGGGPLVCPDPQNPKRYQLTGIVSWGLGCGRDNVPGIYTNVAQLRSWVDSELAKQYLLTASYSV